MKKTALIGFLGVALVLSQALCRADSGDVSDASWPWANSVMAIAHGPWPMDYFTPPAGARRAPLPFEGTLLISGNGPAGVQVHRDDFDLARDPAYNVGTLPPVTLTLISDNGYLVPRRRGPVFVDHPYWEFLPEPGVAWREEGNSEWSRAVLPFSLKEKNQNCLHNGLISFRYGPEGAIGDLAWQVASETCAYLKFDAWGLTPAQLKPGVIQDAAAIKAAYRDEREARMPLRSLADLQVTYPGINMEALAPPAVADATVYGLVIDGVHYRSDCPTRTGAHPFCELVAVPSYSTAKSLFAGLAFLYMANRWPELESLTVPELVPECDLPDGRWQGVHLRNLVDMTSGNYDSAEFHADESDAKMQTFFLATTNSDKLSFSCEAWPHREPPGVQAVYHSTDDYLLGVALQRFLNHESGGALDLHSDILVEAVLGGISPGPLTRVSQRTSDDDAQPFVSYGLFFHPDDVARIGMGLQDDAYLAPLISKDDLEGLRFRDRSAMQEWKLSRGEGYFAGFWGFDVAPHAGCGQETWIPFMSGYGGIRWALLPDGSIYYFFTDGGHGSWMDAIIELNRVRSVCGNISPRG